VAQVTGDKPVPAAIVEQIVARADGVPLFVEELTKAVLESGLLADAGGHYELSGPIPPLAIPATLHDSLLARLDHLAPAKEVAQIGAALGRDFSHALLAAVTDWPEDQLRDALNQLVSSALIFRRGSPPKATYSFKHALVQDAAYQTLLKSKRKQLHTRIVSTLEQYFPETIKSQPEVLARHCDLGDMTEQAIDYWHRAGELAAQRSAVMEAAVHFNRALELLRTSPRTVERLKRELDFLTKLGSVLISAKGPASDEVARVYTDARVLCRSPGETPHLVPVLQGLRVNHMLRAELRPAREAAAELLALGEGIQDAGHLLEGNLAVGILHFYAGEFLPAREHLEKGITFYQTAQHRSHTLRYPDPGQSCLSYTARTLWVLGYPDQALERSEQAVHIADDTSDATSIVQAMAFRADIASLRREFRDAENWARKALDIATEHGLKIWVGGATVTHGWALSQLGWNTAGVSEIKDGRKFLANLRDRLYGIYSASYLAEALSMTGRPREALKQLKKAIIASQSFELPYWDSAFYRLMGQLLLAPGARTDSRAAEACFRQAIEIAQGQQAKSLELRAATSLARLWTDQGNRTEARDLLAPVYGWFTEGFDTADLKDAKSLLDELG
jgi:predicted ATPase